METGSEAVRRHILSSCQCPKILSPTTSTLQQVVFGSLLSLNKPLETTCKREVLIENDVGRALAQI